MNTQNATFAIYRDRQEVKMAVRSFLKLGFTDSALLILQSKRDGVKDFTQVQKSQFKTGAVVGALLGAIFYSGFFLLVSGKFASNTPFVLLIGVLVGGLLGAAGGTLVGIGTPDPAAKRYGQYLQAGGILVSVNSDTPQQIRQAQEVLTATGGQDIQLLDELKTWDKANLERVALDSLQAETEYRTQQEI